jgi:hypothetical protein
LAIAQSLEANISAVLSLERATDAVAEAQAEVERTKLALSLALSSAAKKSSVTAAAFARFNTVNPPSALSSTGTGATKANATSSLYAEAKEAALMLKSASEKQKRAKTTVKVLVSIRSALFCCYPCVGCCF